MHHGLGRVHIHVLGLHHIQAQHEVVGIDALVDGTGTNIDERAGSARCDPVEPGKVGVGHADAFQRLIVVDAHAGLHQDGVVGQSVIAEVGKIVEALCPRLHGECHLVGGACLGKARTGTVGVGQVHVVGSREAHVLHGTEGEGIELGEAHVVVGSLLRVRQTRHVGLVGAVVLPYHRGVDAHVGLALSKPDATTLSTGKIVDDGRGVHMRHVGIEGCARPLLGVDDGSVG